MGNEERCLICGEIIPEGRQVCPMCENGRSKTKPRYIDADALYQEIADWREIIADTYGKNDEYCVCLERVLDLIYDFPTAGLVPEYMKHYRQGLADAEAKRKGELMQAFDPDRKEKTDGLN